MAKLPYRLARHGDGSQIRAELVEPHDNRAWHVFVQHLVSPELEPRALVAAYADTLDTWCSFTSGHAWGSALRKARFRSLVSEPRVLAATQAAVAHCDDANLSLLAALATDGSPASIDALVRHFDRALRDRDRRLDAIVQLRVHAAPTPALQAMLDELEGALAERRAGSPLLSLGPVIGIGEVAELWFWASAAVARSTCRIEVDSRRASRGFAVVLDAPGGRTAFGHDMAPIDQLKLGTCDPAGLPVWLAAAKTRLDGQWTIRVTRTGLRGRKRAQLAAWLAQG